MIDLSFARNIPTINFDGLFTGKRTYFGHTEEEILEATQGAYMEYSIPKVKKLLNSYRRGNKKDLKMAIAILTYLDSND